MSQPAEASPKLFPALLIGFGGQVAGRLVDLQWHLTHEEFEGASEQLQAHWLIWLATLFVLAVAAVGLRDVREPGQRAGYLIVLIGNLAYAVVAVIHFFQHLDHLEVDWAHLLLAITSVVAAVGVLWIVVARFGSRRGRKEAVA
jgi:hypothetical protein